MSCVSICWYVLVSCKSTLKYTMNDAQTQELLPPLQTLQNEECANYWKGTKGQTIELNNIYCINKSDSVRNLRTTTNYIQTHLTNKAAAQPSPGQRTSRWAKIQKYKRTRWFQEIITPEEESGETVNT